MNSVKVKLSREITTDLVTTTCKKVHLRLEMSFLFATEKIPVNAQNLVISQMLKNIKELMLFRARN